ncbi:hypothetical protein P405_19280 [Streptomyces sp. FR-008]|nr:hypothetical protein P405_19280 [Streptomyces sp. FR-008]
MACRVLELAYLTGMKALRYLIDCVISAGVVISILAVDAQDV